MIVMPGPEPTAATSPDESRLVGQAEFLTRIDPINYPNPPESDPQGRITFPALIPGATYRIVDRRASAIRPALHFAKEFTVKPGETLDLGDILIEKPPAQ